MGDWVSLEGGNLFVTDVAIWSKLVRLVLDDVPSFNFWQSLLILRLNLSKSFEVRSDCPLVDLDLGEIEWPAAFKYWMLFSFFVRLSSFETNIWIYFYELLCWWFLAFATREWPFFFCRRSELIMPALGSKCWIVVLISGMDDSAVIMCSSKLSS